MKKAEAWSLSHVPNEKVNYSSMERKLYALIPKDGTPINTLKLMKKYYGNDVPFNGRIIVTGMMRSLIAKVERNKEPFVITKSARNGPNPIEFQVKRR